MNHQPPNPETPPALERRTDPEAKPRIYVASLSDYNAGVLHGRWINATSDVPTMRAEIEAMLRMSPTTATHGDPAEEWAIHDYENFGPLRLDEYSSLRTIARLAGGIHAHGPAFAAYVADTGDNDEQAIEHFEDRYRGEWASVDAYAEALIEDLTDDRTFQYVPDWLRSYIKIDTALFAQDMQLGGDIAVHEKPEGGVWIWDNN